MVDIRRIFEATPVLGLEAQPIASIYGLPGLLPSWVGHRPQLDLYEPPAARREPFADAVEFLRAMQLSQGMDPSTARDRAVEVWRDSRLALSSLDRPVRLDNLNLLGDTETCAVRVLLNTAEERGVATSEQSRFWRKVLLATEETRIYPPQDGHREPRRLRDLPEMPGPMDLFEFVCSLPQSAHYALEPDCKWIAPAHIGRFTEWREMIRPVVARLEDVLGTWVWHFADLDCDTDDDEGHRLLTLHMLAFLLPQSPFVGYVREVSGAESIDELVTALEDPASYFLPFVSHDPFGDDEGQTVWVDANSQTNPRFVGLIADTESALFRLRERALARIGDFARLVLPPGAADADWCAEATRNNRDSAFHYGWEGARAFLDVCSQVTVLFDRDVGMSESGRLLAMELRRLGKAVATVGTDGWTYHNLLDR